MIGLGIITVVTFALIWLVAVPMAAVCPAVAPRGELHPCSAEVRHSAAISWSLVVTAATAVGVVALVLGRRRLRVVRRVTVVALVVVCLVALGQVVSSTGYAVPTW